MANSLEKLTVEKARADRYRLYLAGHAYIPCQDLSKYEKSFRQIYGI